MRADLHVHSWHSGRASHLKFLGARDCYSEPEAIYRVAKARGMDFVCLTDHDSIDGCLEFLHRHPDSTDFIMGEEVECLYPLSRSEAKARGPLRIHVGVLGLNERQHRELQPCRRNVFDLAEYLRGERLFFVLHHLFFFFRGQVHVEDYVTRMLAAFPAFEVRNGAMLEAQNALVGQMCSELARDRGVAPIVSGGSDAHVLRYVGTTWTEVPAQTREDFLAGLKAGHGIAGGAHSSVGRMAAEIYAVIGGYVGAVAGIGRPDLGVWRRAGGAAFVVASLPFQFLPGAIALAQKKSEGRRVEQWARELAGGQRLGIRPAAAVDVV